MLVKKLFYIHSDSFIVILAFFNHKMLAIVLRGLLQVSAISNNLWKNMIHIWFCLDYAHIIVSFACWHIWYPPWSFQTLQLGYFFMACHGFIHRVNTLLHLDILTKYLQNYRFCRIPSSCNGFQIYLFVSGRYTLLLLHLGIELTISR